MDDLTNRFRLLSLHAVAHLTLAASTAVHWADKVMHRATASSSPPPTRKSFPTTLEGFGYRFNNDGELRSIDTDERFKFLVKPNNHAYNQAHYEALGAVVTAYIESELQSTFEMVKQTIPLDADDDEPKSRIYMSKDALTSDKPLLLLIPGSMIEVGQWARKIVINDNINTGSIFNCVRAARAAGYEVLAMNPNYNYEEGDEEAGRWRGSRGRVVRGSETPSDHVEYVWREVVMQAKTKDVLMVAHSAGGYNTQRLVYRQFQDVAPRVRAIALTDSVHGVGFRKGTGEAEWWFERVINWVTSSEPVDKVLGRSGGCMCRSAGDTRHDYTTVYAEQSVFKWFERMFTSSPSPSNPSSSDSPTQSSKRPQMEVQSDTDTDSDREGGDPMEMEEDGVFDAGEGEKKAAGERGVEEWLRRKERATLKPVDDKTDGKPGKKAKGVKTVDWEVVEREERREEEKGKGGEEEVMGTGVWSVGERGEEGGGAQTDGVKEEGGEDGEKEGKEEVQEDKNGVVEGKGKGNGKGKKRDGGT
ncbi:hypothetical protein HDV00_011031 [Rhizophlyctis rosea]|nr:hypothetical protein HDV00_011031 [Rhizophlyctis rosea]